MFSLIPVFIAGFLIARSDEFKQSGLTLLVLLPLMLIHFLLVLKSPERRGKIMITFLRAHWYRAGQEPKSQKHELSLAIRSMLKGKVVFPNNKIDSDVNYSLFVYPAKDFGTSKTKGTKN